MNKLASIYFLHKQGLPTVNPQLILKRTESQVREAVNSFYRDRKLGWVLRCGGDPDEQAKVERGLPWAKAKDREDLVQQILKMQKDIGPRYFVFCHPAFDLIRGGVMLIEGKGVIIEAASGNDRELSAMFRGHRNPQQTLQFKPGMLSFSCSGESVLTANDLNDMRMIERTLNWSDINAVVNPVAIEFSRLGDGSLYVHDLSLI
ncbi:Uncharacterised protein [uncultured archaeon]|nr:Uncharacterised protein [uncultured archaeon]